MFEKNSNQIFHITTATHDSRTSKRMRVYKIREKRDNGMHPRAQPIWLDAKGEELITSVVANIVEEDNLDIIAYNICVDHMHLLLVCEEEDVPKIMQKIKSITAKIYNRSVGRTREPAPLSTSENDKKQHVSLWTQKFGCKKVTSRKQLYNTIRYIRNNRLKHKLPAHSIKTMSYIEKICTSDYKDFEITK